jgi:hypothetical protein
MKYYGRRYTRNHITLSFANLCGILAQWHTQCSARPRKFLGPVLFELPVRAQQILCVVQVCTCACDALASWPLITKAMAAHTKWLT